MFKQSGDSENQISYRIRGIRKIKNSEIQRGAAEKESKQLEKIEKIRERVFMDPVIVMANLGQSDVDLIGKMVEANNRGDEKAYREWKKVWLKSGVDKFMEKELPHDEFLEDPNKILNDSYTEIEAEFETFINKSNEVDEFQKSEESAEDEFEQIAEGSSSRLENSTEKEEENG